MTATLDSRHIGYFGEKPPSPDESALFVIMLVHPTEIGGEGRVLVRHNDRMAAGSNWSKARVFRGRDEADEAADRWRQYDWRHDDDCPRYVPVVVPFGGPITLGSEAAR